MENAYQFTQRMQQLLSDIGATQLTEAMVRKCTRECRDDVYADNLAHGGCIEDPFVNFITLGNAAVFTFFTIPFEVYVIQCDEYELISDFEGSGFAMSDVQSYRDLLSYKYAKQKPDIVVDRVVAEHWMES